VEDIYSYKSISMNSTSSLTIPLDDVNLLPNSLVFEYEFVDNIRIDCIATFLNNESSKNLFAVMGSSGEQKRFNGVSPLNSYDIRDSNKRKEFISKWTDVGNQYESDYEQFIDRFSRIFVGKSSLKRTSVTNNTKLSPDASNLSQILGVIFENELQRNDFVEWLRILIPEFRNIEIKKSNIDGSYDFSIFEKGSKKPFPKHLISDGTYNILSLMAVVCQSNQSQFLCIEEPENGLHPQAIELLVDFFREKCEEKGHHIWLNTHSQTLVRCMEIDEIILVNKVNGETQAKQLTKDEAVHIKTDEAWLSNALGGGVLWSK
jgi:predicted ATPase